MSDDIKAKEISQAQLLQAISDANKAGSCVRYGLSLVQVLRLLQGYHQAEGLQHSGISRLKKR